MLESVTRASTLIITNVVKVAGLYVGVRTAMHTPADPVTLAFAAFLIAGGQVSENVVMGIIDRFFGIKRDGG